MMLYVVQVVVEKVVHCLRRRKEGCLVSRRLELGLSVLDSRL